jgi:hypothetical protein
MLKCFKFWFDAPINNSVLIDSPEEHSINFVTDAPQRVLWFGFGFQQGVFHKIKNWNF